jgi:hypothetical protein
MAETKTVLAVLFGAIFVILIVVVVFSSLPGTPCGSQNQTSCPLGKFCSAGSTCESCPSGSGTQIPNCPTEVCPYTGVTSCWMNTRGIDGTGGNTISYTGVSGHNPSYYGGWNVSGPEDAISTCKATPGCRSLYYTPVGPNPDNSPSTSPAVWLFKNTYADTPGGGPVSRFAGDGTKQYPTPLAGSFTANIA